MSEGARRRVSYAQLETLCDFLDQHKDIATGYNKSARARDHSKKMWLRISEVLNAHGDGAIKDWKSWSKVLEQEDSMENLVGGVILVLVFKKVARRTLINIAKDRVRQHQLQNEVLQQMVAEIKDLNQLLRTRLPEPALQETPNLNLS